MAQTCGFEGNSDIYGLGLRLGIYLQWATSIFAENFYEPAVESTRDTNSTFQVAMTCGYMYLIHAQADDTWTVDGYLALLFCFAGACVASLQNVSAAQASITWGMQRRLPTGGDPSAFPPPTSSVRRLRAFLEMTLNALLSSHGIWFMFRGIRNLRPTPANCPEQGFFFAPVRLFGWYHVILGVLFIASLGASVILIVGQLLYFAAHVPHSILSAFRRRMRDQTEDEARNTQPVWMSPNVTVSIVRLAGSLVALSFFVIAVETTLSWNHVRDIYQCADFSQLFPLMIGLTNFLRVLAQFMKNSLRGNIILQWSLL